jgi:hypothetical protein
VLLPYRPRTALLVPDPIANQERHVFAYSIWDGQRAHFFTTRSVVIINLGNVTGPLVALIIFTTLRHKWTIQACLTVMVVGQFISLPAVFLLFFLNDDAASGAKIWKMSNCRSFQVDRRHVHVFLDVHHRGEKVFTAKGNPIGYLRPPSTQQQFSG